MAALDENGAINSNSEFVLSKWKKKQIFESLYMQFNLENFDAEFCQICCYVYGNFND